LGTYLEEKHLRGPKLGTPFRAKGPKMAPFWPLIKCVYIYICIYNTPSKGDPKIMCFKGEDPKIPRTRVPRVRMLVYMWPPGLGPQKQTYI
jgi:hypothetical protein